MAKRRSVAALTIAAAVLLAFGCAPKKDSTATGTTAPGVTADAKTIKVGVTYPDTKALAAVNLNYDLGDYAATYKALFDQINKEGGINGRKIEGVYAPIDPTKTASADEVCLKLTEDEHVFLMTGFFLGDAVNCPLDDHNTAVVGGNMTPERLARAKAPWLSWAPDTDQPVEVTDTFAKQGLLKGKVALFAASADSALVKDQVVPELTKLGIKPVATGLMDAPADDTAAVRNSVKLLAQRYKAAGADTILAVGEAAASWPGYMADDPSYRPKLLFTDVLASRAFATSAATTDTSILDNSLSAGGYGPDQARYDEAEMQKCVKILKAAGVKSPPPSASGSDPSNQPYQAAFNSCPDVALMKAWLSAAGKDLSYASMKKAEDGLKVTIPGDPAVRTYGPPPAADGNPKVYIFKWDKGTKNFVLAKP